MSNVKDATNRVTNEESRNRTARNPNREADIPRLLQCLFQEHRYLAALVGVLESKAVSPAPLRMGDYYLLRDIAAYLHDYPDQVHHPTEDVLFGKLERRQPSMKGAIRRMRLDHETVMKETEALLDLLNRAIEEHGKELEESVRNACHSFATHQREHMEFENQTLFAAAIEALKPSDWRAIEHRFSTREDPLFGRIVGRQHRTLYEYLIGPNDETSGKLSLTRMRLLERMIRASGTIVNGADAFGARLRELAELLSRETRSALKQSLQRGDPVSAAVLPIRHGAFLASSVFRCNLDLLRILTTTIRDAFAHRVRGAVRQEELRDC
jgi:hemerythrin-like domain-containing protein